MVEAAVVVADAAGAVVSEVRVRVQANLQRNKVAFGVKRRHLVVLAVVVFGRLSEVDLVHQ